MSYLRYLCLFAHSSVQPIFVLYFCFVFLRRVYLYVASFSRLSIFDLPFGILERLVTSSGTCKPIMFESQII